MGGIEHRRRGKAVGEVVISIPRSTASGGGPPGTRTRNLRIKSPFRTCWSEGCVASELRVCVSVLPMVSRWFPFLHGDRTGTTPRLALSFRSHSRPGENLILKRWRRGPCGRTGSWPANASGRGGARDRGEGGSSGCFMKCRALSDRIHDNCTGDEGALRWQHLRMPRLGNGQHQPVVPSSREWPHSFARSRLARRQLISGLGWRR
jgi:hypothetical protein